MNTLTRFNLMQYFNIVMLSCAVFSSNISFAAPGNLPKTPLFLTNAVEPNIFYALDDSGSMEWEQMVSQGTAGMYTDGGVPIRGGVRRYYILPTNANGIDGYYASNFYPYTVPSTATDSLAWIQKTHHGNALYYNPSIKYEPWSGTDALGNPLYTSVTDATKALIDPNNPSFGTFDLTTSKTFTGYMSGWVTTTIFPATYFEWVDTDSDGVLENTDGNVRVEIKSGNTFSSGRTYADEILNFANWFQYYRKRSYVAKAALGVTVNNTDAYRMGIDIFTGGHQVDAESMSVPASKAAMFNSLYNLGIYCGPGKGSIYPTSCHGTPALASLDRVGRLFQGSTSNPSPIQSLGDGGECQQNFSMLVSDGYWNDSTAPAGIGNADKDDSGSQETYLDSNSNVLRFDGGHYDDNHSVTLADVAMHYYEHDLSALDDLVPTQTGVDEADHQHLVTYTIGFGINGTLDPTTDDPTTSTTFWPDPTDVVDDERIDDMWHAAYNGRGKYLNAKDPEELAKALSEVAQDIADKTAIAAAVAINSARLTSQSVVYLAQFNTNKWQGTLSAYPIIDLNLGTLSAAPNWEAGAELNGRDFVLSPRTMITYDGSNGVPFRWSVPSTSTPPTPPLHADMIADLKVNPAGGTDSDTIAEKRLEYLRGDRSEEGGGGQFRTRVSLLGDLVNSGPVFVGEPTLNWPDVSPFPSNAGSRYSDYKNGPAKTRKEIVYVGANDGMLHGFDDHDGKEVFAYVPLALASSSTTFGFHYLTNPAYAHNWYLDLTPTISDVSMTTNAGSGWRSILVGGLRGGGRGLFALDVTDPSLFSNEANAAKISMWEFTDADDSDLGYTYSRPVIAMANNGRWVAIFGNGYNDQGSGEASLFILDIEKGVDGWGAGDYKKISTKVGTTTNRNGLSSPALADLDGNGTVDRVYAGDLEGNMWVFDLSQSDTSKWESAYLQGTNPKPLFTTQNNRPITAKPVLAKHPTIPLSSSPSNDPNIMVFFGTGQYLVDADKTTTTTESFYGVWDRGDRELLFVDLIEQTFDSSYTDRVLTQNFVDYSVDHGWFFDFPIAGERAVTSPIARADAVFFNTFVPEINPCSVGGYGYKFAVDMTTGGAPEETIIDINGDGVIDASDNVGGGTVVVSAVKQSGYLPAPVFIEDLVFTGKIASKSRKLPPPPEGRFSWQELLK